MTEEVAHTEPATGVPDDLHEFLECADLMKKRIRIERASLLFSEKGFFWWNGRTTSALHDEQQAAIDDLLETASGVHFDKMSATTKQILWKGVRFYYGLSENDLPYPVYLDAKRLASKKIDPLKREDQQSKRNRTAVAVLAFIVCAFAAGLLVGNALLPSSQQWSDTLSNTDALPVPHLSHAERTITAVPMRSSSRVAP